MGGVGVDGGVSVVLGQEPAHGTGGDGLAAGGRRGVVVVRGGGDGRPEQGRDGERCGGREAAANSGAHRVLRRRATARPAPVSTSSPAATAAPISGAPVGGRPQASYSASVISRTSTVSVEVTSRSVSVQSPQVSTQSAPSQAIELVRCSVTRNVSRIVVTVPYPASSVGHCGTSRSATSSRSRVSVPGSGLGPTGMGFCPPSPKCWL